MFVSFMFVSFMFFLLFYFALFKILNETIYHHGTYIWTSFITLCDHCFINFFLIQYFSIFMIRSICGVILHFVHWFCAHLQVLHMCRFAILLIFHFHQIGSFHHNALALLNYSSEHDNIDGIRNWKSSHVQIFWRSTSLGDDLIDHWLMAGWLKVIIIPNKTDKSTVNISFRQLIVVAQS